MRAVHFFQEMDNRKTGFAFNFLAPFEPQSARTEIGISRFSRIEKILGNCMNFLGFGTSFD